MPPGLEGGWIRLHRFYLIYCHPRECNTTLFFVGCSHSCLFQTAVVAYSEIMGVSEKLWFIIILESQAESS